MRSNHMQQAISRTWMMCLALSALPDCTMSTLVLLADLVSCAILLIKEGSDCN